MDIDFSPVSRWFADLWATYGGEIKLFAAAVVIVGLLVLAVSEM